LAKARNGDKKPAVEDAAGVWTSYRGGPDAAVAESETGVNRGRLAQVLQSIVTLPPDFHPHPKIKRGLELRVQQARGERPLDWATAEAAAFGTLAPNAAPVRLDSPGTFSQPRRTSRRGNGRSTRRSSTRRPRRAQLINSPPPRPACLI
jgi:2-oxoglutarate dehydrogenase E1 component